MSNRNAETKSEVLSERLRPMQTQIAMRASEEANRIR